MKLNKITTNFAILTLVLGLSGVAHADQKTMHKSTKPMKKMAMKQAATKSAETTTTTSSNILPVASVSPSFYVIGSPMLPDPVEPSAAPESRAGYSILPATPTLNASTPEAGATVPGTLQAAIGIEPEYAVLTRLIAYAGLSAEIRKPGPFTLLAPTNSAFAKIPEETLNSLLLPENRDKLRQMLMMHIIVGDVRAAQLSGMTTISTMGGTSLPISTANGMTTVGGAKIFKADVSCANGVIHSIDTVLMPQ